MHFVVYCHYLALALFDPGLSRCLVWDVVDCKYF